MYNISKTPGTNSKSNPWKGDIRHGGAKGKLSGRTSSGRIINKRAHTYTSVPLNKFYGSTLADKSYNRGYYQTQTAYDSGGITLVRDICRIFAAIVKHRTEILHDNTKSNQWTAFRTALRGLQGSIQWFTDNMLEHYIPPLALKWRYARNPYKKLKVVRKKLKYT